MPASIRLTETPVSGREGLVDPLFFVCMVVLPCVYGFVLVWVWACSGVACDGGLSKRTSPPSPKEKNSNTNTRATNALLMHFLFCFSHLPSFVCRCVVVVSCLLMAVCVWCVVYGVCFRDSCSSGSRGAQATKNKQKRGVRTCVAAGGVCA